MNLVEMELRLEKIAREREKIAKEQHQEYETHVLSIGRVVWEKERRGHRTGCTPDQTIL